MFTQQTLLTEKVESTIAQYFAASRGNNKPVEMAACFAEDCTSQDPADSPMLKGRAEVQQFFETIVALFASVELREEFVSIRANEAAVKWKGFGIGKNGCEVTFEGIDLIEVNKDGKIQTLRAYWDPAPTLAKLQHANLSND